MKPRYPLHATLPLLLILGVAPRIAAQAHSHAAGAAHEEAAPAPVMIPAELLARPLPLRQGIGSAHEPVPTHSVEAQAFMTRGSPIYTRT